METLILTTSKEDIDKAAEILRNGGLVAFPTETVYGLGANALDPDAVKRVYLAKGRPSDNPMIVHIGEKEGLRDLTDMMTRDMELLMEAIWPGPMTMVVPAKDIVPRVTTGGLDTVAVRMPSDETARQLIIRSGVPIAAPSANLSGHPSPTTYRHCIDDLMGRVDAIICGEDCQVGIESTVIDMTGGDEKPPVILRPGIVTAERISQVLGKEVSLDPSLLKRPEIDKNTGNPVTGQDFRPRSPGMKYKHYAPQAEMTIFRGPHEAVLRTIGKRRAELEAQGLKVAVITYSDSEQETAARQFFARLRECDKDGTDVILASALKEEGVGFSVMNRMFKSAGYNIEEVKEEKMKIAIASDHGGFALKENIRAYMAEKHPEIEMKDLGTYNEESVDYPLFGKLCGETVVTGAADLGIVCCGTGIGISIAANKVKGVRCALVTSVEMAHLAKEHNNANVLALGGRTTRPEAAFEMIEEWLATEFAGGRHQRRTDLLDNM